MIRILPPLLPSYRPIPTEQPEESQYGAQAMLLSYKNPPMTLRCASNKTQLLTRAAEYRWHTLTHLSHLWVPSPHPRLSSSCTAFLFLLFRPASLYSHLGILAMAKVSLRKAKAFPGLTPPVRSQLKGQGGWPHSRQQLQSLPVTWACSHGTPHL